MTDETRRIFLKLDSQKYFVMAYLTFDTPYTDPEKGGFKILNFSLNGEKKGTIHIDWVRAELRVTENGNGYLVGDCKIAEVYPEPMDSTDIVLLIVSAIQADNPRNFVHRGPGLSRRVFDKKFQEWAATNL